MEIVIAASYWGKFKTVSQMIMIIFDYEHSECSISGAITVFVVIAIALTIISLVDYIMKKQKCMQSSRIKRRWHYEAGRKGCRDFEKASVKTDNHKSCTGWSHCGRIVDVPGASEVFEQGVCDLFNEAKMRAVKVQGKCLKNMVQSVGNVPKKWFVEDF